VNDKKVADGRIERTEPMMFSSDDAADVGIDEGTPVTEDYASATSGFTGKILKVKVDVKPMGAGEKAGASKAAAETSERLDASN
jgi:arylsulfatase